MTVQGDDGRKRLEIGPRYSSFCCEKMKLHAARRNGFIRELKIEMKIDFRNGFEKYRGSGRDSSILIAFRRNDAEHCVEGLVECSLGCFL
jgi:hypothetical protein